jgi:tryptophanyl-tRNA synthetase
MRPTGRLHLGHLVGALKNWADLQQAYDCFYFVADWHALTSEYADTAGLTGNALDNVADWIAAGVDPERSTIFVQSLVPEHAELFVLLSMVVPIPWLERVPTYKEQLQQMAGRDLSTYGFLGYPVLQAADILIYKANRVPVGEDQVAHVEMAREIARRFNTHFGNVFVEPQELLTPTPRLLGIDGKKMSKSLDNCIYLGDSPEEIERKIRQMVTDPLKIRKTDPGRPEICSVYDYHKVFDPAGHEGVRVACIEGRLGCVEHKVDLARKLAERLRPIREKRAELAAKRGEILDILRTGSDAASRVTRETMHEVREALGLW